jgi:putative Holliday junction resolvase
MPSSIIAFDHGQKRIGVAIASSVSRLPQPLATLENVPGLLDQIKAIVKEHNAKYVVVGLPRNMEGAQTKQSAAARQFAQKLQGSLGLPVHLIDESLTSKQAEAELAERGIGYNKEHVDSLAAVYILEDFLKAHKEVGD